jgi:hypothetical protein
MLSRIPKRLLSRHLFKRLARQEILVKRLANQQDKWIERLVAGGFGLSLGSIYLAVKR